MSYTILDRPSGTTAFEPGILEQISPLLKAGAKGIGDSMYRKAATKAGLQPSYKQDAEGNWTTAYEQKDNNTLEAINKMFGIKKNMKEAAIDAEAPRLAKATNYFQKAIESGGDPAKLTEMIKPERFAYPEQQKEIRSAMETGTRIKKGMADQAWKPKTREDQLQFETDKVSARTTPKATQPKTITPAQALGIMSDPFKAAEFKKSYPEQYGQLEKIGLSAMSAPDAPATEKPTIRKTATSAGAEKSVVNRVGVLRKTGWSDEKIAEALRQKNIDPLLYGIKEK